MKKERQINYCRFCGSSKIKMKVDVNSGLTIDKVIDPEINIPEETGIPVKFRVGKYGKMKSKEFHFRDTYCKTCKNINVVDIGNPKEVTSNRNKAAIVIPTILNEQLEINDYQPDEIIQLITSITKKLEKIYKKWSEDGGNNPCQGNKVGRKIKIQLHSGWKIPCNVIVETICRKIVFRLCYGGGNVNCD